MSLSETILPTPPNKSRRRKSNPEEWKKTKDKRKRHMPTQRPEPPRCFHNGPTYKCKSLRMSDGKEFHDAFYKYPVKTQQDTFILKHIEVSLPQRERSKQNGGKKSVAVKYLVKIKGTKDFKIQVCQKTFLGILGVSRFRVNNIAKNYATTEGLLKKEVALGS
ncbi:hypothetical protein J6590_082284 [Homalodisca vitripennis]|nr:hypothetical protein J6590_082284 [Homalodisca vitripennis]